MRPPLWTALTTAVALAALAAGKGTRAMAEAERVTVRFAEAGAALANPHKGWMTFQRLPRREPRFPCTVAYFRLNWAEVEPEDGRRDWKALDQPLAAWAKRGTRIAFRIMTANAHTRGYYCSPKWLFDAGCKSYDYVRGGEDTMAGGKRITRIEPDYGDPLFLAKHGAFIKALGERYDGHEGIELLDIGSYGIWGEWHTPHGKPWAVRKQIIDLYLAAFKKTPLVSMSDDAQALAYATAHGTGVRRDGVGSPWHEKTWIGSKKYAGVKGFAAHWQRAPMVFEWFGPYDFLLRRQWSFDRAIDFMLRNHVTYICDNVGRVPDGQMPKLVRLAKLAGYRFVLREASWPATVPRGKTLAVTMAWENVARGKLYRRYPLVLCLLKKDGSAAARQAQDHVDPTQWHPGRHPVVGSIGVPPALAPGVHTVGVALADPTSGKPAIRLAIEAPQQGLVYRLGAVRVVE